MKTQKVYFYVIKLLALIVLSYLTIKDHDKTISLILVAFITAILIWEGIRDLGTRNRKVHDPSDIQNNR